MTPITKLERRNGVEYWAAGSLMGRCWQDITGKWFFRPEVAPNYEKSDQTEATDKVLDKLRTTKFSCEQSVFFAALIWANEQRQNGWL